MTRSSTKTRAGGTYLGDLIRYEANRGYNYVSGKIVNPSSTDIVGQLALGQPVKASGSDFVFVKAGDEAATIGLFADQRPINLDGSATSDDQFLILRRGPATVAKEAIPAKDMDAGGGDDGTALTAATIVTALAGLSPPIIALDPLTPTKTQTT